MPVRARIIQGAAAALLAAGSSAQAADKVMIGEQSWPGAKLIAYLIQEVITARLGGEAELVPGSNAVIFAAMDDGDGDIDVHPDVWLPNQKSLTDKYVTQKGTVTLSEGYYEGRSGFCVPTYMAEEHGIRSVFDLATPRAEELFDSDGDGKGEIWIGSSGWASTAIHKVKARDYGIDTFLEPGTQHETVFYAKLEEAIERRKGVVFYCYKPHYVHALYDLTMLKEPPHDPDSYTMVQPNETAEWFERSHIMSGDPVKSVHVAYSTSLERRAPEAAAFLERIDLDSEIVSKLTYEVVAEGREPAAVAANWVEANGETVDAWLGID